MVVLLTTVATRAVTDRINVGTVGIADDQRDWRGGKQTLSAAAAEPLVMIVPSFVGAFGTVLPGALADWQYPSRYRAGSGFSRLFSFVKSSHFRHPMLFQTNCS